MVNKDTSELDRIFMALADPTRRAILQRLSEGEAPVTELAAPFDMSLPAVTKHLNVLEQAGLLRREKDGRIRRCHIEHRAMQQAALWIDYYRQFWDVRLDRLERYVRGKARRR